jgi:lysophospholipase L1-like esterase
VPRDDDEAWVGTWTTAPAPSKAGETFDNHTLRMNPRVSIGSDAIRVRVSNAYGESKLEVGAASVGIRAQGSAIVVGSGRELTFSGSRSVTVAAGSLVVSDPVELSVDPLTDLAVSLHLPGRVLPELRITGRYARQVNYLSPPGDFVDSVELPVWKITDEWFFLCGVDVLAPSGTGGIVAFGDSLTDANLSTHDAHCRWPDQLARRLVARPGGRSLGVMNQGLGGNRLLHDLRGDSGLRRFDRDVLAQPGVTHAIVMLGTNDLCNRDGGPDEEVTADQLIGGLHQLALRGQARGVEMFGATLIPFADQTFMPGAWNPVREGHRIAFNEWIRETDVLDGVVDFDEALSDPANPTRLHADHDCGDGLHPSDAGYCRMGDSIELDMFG